MTLKKKLLTYKQFVENKEQPDWDEYTEQWKHDVSDMQQTIMERWFKDYEEEKLVTFNLVPVSRFEEKLGAYLIPTLEMVFPNNRTVIIEPIAGVVIGSNGKVDMYLSGSVKEKVVLLRNFKHDSKTSYWTIVKTFNGKEQLNFNKTNLENIIEEWLQ